MIERYRTRERRRHFRADAAFARPELHEFLDAEGFPYAIRLPTNSVLKSWIAMQGPDRFRVPFDSQMCYHIWALKVFGVAPVSWTVTDLGERGGSWFLSKLIGDR